MIPKDKNGTIIVDRDRVRRADGGEGEVIDTEAGAGAFITLIGVMWDGERKAAFLASRDVEIIPGKVKK